MGKKDNIEKEYLKHKEEFADVINLALGQGQKLVSPEDIYELDSNELVTISSINKNDTESIQKYRDVIRMVRKRDGDVFKTRIIIGEEVQSHVHYGMPVRNMLYDSINYTNQIKSLESFNRKNREFTNSDEFLSGLKGKDKIIPVVTIVVYFSPDKWNGPSSLYEMFEWSEVPDNLKEYIQNYKIILLQPCDIDTDKLDKTESTLGKLMGLIKYSKDENDFNNYIEKNRETFSSFPVYATQVINSVCSLNISEEDFEREEMIDVCQAVLEIRRKSKEEGKTEGRIEGITEGRIEGKILAYYDLGMDISDIARRVGLTEEEVIKVLEKNKYKVNS